MNELKKHVERAVRPVAARETRKDKMREELLAHLTAIFEEESARLGDEQAAMQRALDRFGEPVELTGELQDAVPVAERVLFAPLFPRTSWFLVARRPGEAVVQYELRIVRYAMLSLAVVCVALVTLSAVRTGSFKSIGVIASCLTNAAAMAVLFTWLNDGMRKAICRGFAPSRSLTRAAVYGVVASCAVVASGLAFAATMNWNAGLPIFTSSALPLLLIAAIAAPFYLALLARLTAAEIRRYEEWGSLDIEET